jgi:hypothetical protein
MLAELLIGKIPAAAYDRIPVLATSDPDELAAELTAYLTSITQAVDLAKPEALIREEILKRCAPLPKRTDFISQASALARLTTESVVTRSGGLEYSAEMMAGETVIHVEGWKLRVRGDLSETLAWLEEVREATIQELPTTLGQAEFLEVIRRLAQFGVIRINTTQAN